MLLFGFGRHIVVDCRIGSLENIGECGFILAVVDCRIGSLEISKKYESEITQS